MMSVLSTYSVRWCITEETGGKKLIFNQGDNIRGKISHDDMMWD